MAKRTTNKRASRRGARQARSAQKGARSAQKGARSAQKGARSAQKGARNPRKAARAPRKAAKSSRNNSSRKAASGATRARSARNPAAARPPPTGRWLVKTEPGTYAYADLEREGRTVWEGVRNALARIHLRAMREGDLVLVYHTGAERSVAGLSRVVAGPRAPVPPIPGDDKAVVVDLAAVARAAPPVPADDLRAEPSCRDLALFTIPRLSVMPVPLDAFGVIAARGGFA